MRAKLRVKVHATCLCSESLYQCDCRVCVMGGRAVHGGGEYTGDRMSQSG